MYINALLGHELYLYGVVVEIQIKFFLFETGYYLLYLRFFNRAKIRVDSKIIELDKALNRNKIHLSKFILL